MADIEEAGRMSAEFLKNSLKLQDVKIVKAWRDGDGWETEVEVYEDSSFIKCLGLPTCVKDRNIYTVKLDEHLGVQSFERKRQEKR